MKKLDTTYAPCTIKAKLNSIDHELASPQITSLLSQGYIITSIIPVSDDGIPTVILFFEHREKPFVYNINARHIAAAMVFCALTLFFTAMTLQYFAS